MPTINSRSRLNRSNAETAFNDAGFAALVRQLMRARRLTLADLSERTGTDANLAWKVLARKRHLPEVHFPAWLHTLCSEGAMSKKLLLVYLRSRSTTSLRRLIDKYL